MRAPSPAVFCRTALLPVGWCADVRIGIAGGRIADVAVGVAAQAGDARCAVAVPGLANVHSHAFQRALAGLAERRGVGADSFWTWREVMYRFLDRIGPDDAEAIACQAYAEMLEGGFTRVGEFHYLHRDPAGAAYADPAEMAGRVAAAAARTGIGLTLLPCFYAHGGFGGAAPVAGQRRFIHALDGFARVMEASGRTIAALADANLGVAPHSLRAVSGAELAALLALYRGMPVHIHAAEQTEEVDACVAATGARPVQWLLAHAPVDARWCLIHATQMTAAEVAGLAGSGAVAGLCPLTEASLGDGVFPAGDFVGAGGRFGVGTDSNICIDAAAELRQLEYGQRLRDRARNVLAGAAGGSTGRALFEAALHGGAQALGQAPVGLVAGAAADIVALDDTHPSLVGRGGDALLDGWVFAAARPAVERVWRAGMCVVEGGRHVQADAIGARYAACLKRLLA